MPAKLKVLVWFVLLAIFVNGQSSNTGTVVGTVRDPSQMLVPNAQAEIRNSATGYKQTVATDETGAFRFINVPPNMYDLVISAPGFEDLKEPLEVRTSAPLSLTYTLKMGEVTTSVDVSTATPLIDTDPAALYNFLSTFSGSHFLPPRTYQISVGYTF